MWCSIVCHFSASLLFNNGRKIIHNSIAWSKRPGISFHGPQRSGLESTAVKPRSMWVRVCPCWTNSAIFRFLFWWFPDFGILTAFFHEFLFLCNLSWSSKWYYIDSYHKSKCVYELYSMAMSSFSYFACLFIMFILWSLIQVIMYAHFSFVIQYAWNWLIWLPIWGFWKFNSHLVTRWRTVKWSGS